MATPQIGVWGIDLGQCALKAIRLQKINDEVVATAFDYIEHPKILSQPDADPDQLTREALEQFLARNSIKGDVVVISVPGQSGLARFVKLPPVEEKKIADIVKFEAKQQIPFPLEEVVWDFQRIGSGMVTDGFAMETEIGLFAIKRDMVNRALQQFKDVDVEVHLVQMTPLALCNFVAYDLLDLTGDKATGEDTGDKKQCIVALDIGTDNSNLVITDGGKIIWQRPIPLGGNHFTRALTKDMKLTFAKAEHLKRNAVKSPDLKKILASLKTVLNDFVGEAQRSLGYFTNTHRDASIQYMVGLGNAFRLPGLQKYLQEKLGLEVRKITHLERVKGEDVTAAPTFQENLLSFAVAYGLALQGLSLTRIQTNLLPHEIRFERVIRRKKPYALAAAAALLLAVAGLTFGQSEAFKAVTNPGIGDAKKKADTVKKLVDKLKADNDAELQRLKDAIDAQTRIAAGVDERFNWQHLYQYINMALPRPNGEKLTETSRAGVGVRERYATKNAGAALAMLEEKRFAKPGATVDPAKAAQEEIFIKKNLIQVNIEGVLQLYSEELHDVFKKMYEKTEALPGMAERERHAVINMIDKAKAEALGADVNNLPKLPEKGWVVEIRGYTYHDDGEKFVVNTLLENLAVPESVGNDLPPILADYSKESQIRGKITRIDDAKLTFRHFNYKFGDPTTVNLANEVKVFKMVKDQKEPAPEGLKLGALSNLDDKKGVGATLIMSNDRVSEIILSEVKTKGEFVVLYENQTVKNPLPGVFKHINAAHLPKVVGGGGAKDNKGFPGGPPGKEPKQAAPPGGPPGEGDGGGKVVANRAGWRALGDMARGALGGNANAGGTAGGGAADAQNRVEFVILFIWREPLTGEPQVEPSQK